MVGCESRVSGKHFNPRMSRPAGLSFHTLIHFCVTVDTYFIVIYHRLLHVRILKERSRSIASTIVGASRFSNDLTSGQELPGTALEQN